MSTLGTHISRFFNDHLPLQRGASANTIRAYRDTFVLLLEFLAAQNGVEVNELPCASLTEESILSFLSHLETDRHAQPSTRNHRLAGIHSFCKYLQRKEPSCIDNCNSNASTCRERSRHALTTAIPSWPSSSRKRRRRALHT